MAKKSGVSIQTKVYSTFRGADFSTDPSLVESYRSPLCTNIVADGGGMPQKRVGWRTIHRMSGKVHGLFQGVFEGHTVRLTHVGTKLYLWEDDEETEPAELMSGLPEHKSRAVFMNGKLWIVTGAGYLVVYAEEPDEEDPQTVEERMRACLVSEYAEAYIPTTSITRMPTGGGVSYEDINMMTPWRKNEFQCDGSATDFLLDGIVDADTEPKAWVFGDSGWEEKTYGTDFHLNDARDTVEMEEAPPAPAAGSQDMLRVQFAATVEGYAERINACSIITTYGLGNNDRVVLSGNAERKNEDWTSGLNDPTYIPDLGYSVVGSEATAIRGYLRVGSSLAVVKEDNGQDSTVFLRSASTDSDGGAIFPQQQAIAGVGAVAPGSFATLLDDPMFLSRTGITAIATQTITSEKICQGRSYRINTRLTAEPELTEAEAVIWNGLYMLALPNGHVYCLDGRQSKNYTSYSKGDFVYECYYWENVPAVCWMDARGGAEEELFFGTEDGRICKFSTDITSMAKFSDDGAAIDAVWATKYDDDGTPAVLKTMLKRGCCVTIKPYNRSSGTAYFRTDRTEGMEKQMATKPMDILDFRDIDFERFTFNTDDSPQEIFFNRKIKNYKRLQIVIRNSEPNEGFGVFQITKQYVVGNYGKR